MIICYIFKMFLSYKCCEIYFVVYENIFVGQMEQQGIVVINQGLINVRGLIMFCYICEVFVGKQLNYEINILRKNNSLIENIIKL